METFESGDLSWKQSLEKHMWTAKQLLDENCEVLSCDWINSTCEVKNTPKQLSWKKDTPHRSDHVEAV